MTVREIADSIGLEVLCGSCDREVSGVYAGDLLSWVMSRLTEDKIWITIMSNVNVVAVASLADAACVILAESVVLDDDALAAAETKDVTVLTSHLDTYTLCREIALLIEKEDLT